MHWGCKRKMVRKGNQEKTRAYLSVVSKIHQMSPRPSKHKVLQSNQGQKTVTVAEVDLVQGASFVLNKYAC